MTQNGVTTTYTYDENNRLESETAAGVAKTYTYDNNGNLINAWNGGNPVGAYAYNLFGNQISYTPDGVLYTYYTYRLDGLRHSIGDKVHVWDGANIVADVDGSDVVVYIRGINLIYADDGSRTYYHFNAHGDVVVLTNASGNKTKSYSYNAFGVEYNEAMLDNNPFRYCGEYYDKETKTIYLRARYYDSAQGRFTQEDPVRDGYNWYTYCSGNPVNFIDPTGYSAVKCDFKSETDPNKFLDRGPSGGGSRNQYLQTVSNALTVVAAIALTAYVANSIAENPPLPMNKFIAMEEAKAETKTEVEVEAQEKVKVQERNYYVYVLLNEDTSQVEYVGRTLDPVKRAQAHAKDPNRSHLTMRIIHKDLTLEEARGLEQVEMLYYHTYKAVYKSGKNSCNKIKGISPKNRNREIYMEAAIAYFENIVSNEFYCLEELFGK